MRLSLRARARMLVGKRFIMAATEVWRCFGFPQPANAGDATLLGTSPFRATFLDNPMRISVTGNLSSKNVPTLGTSIGGVGRRPAPHHLESHRTIQLLEQQQKER